MNRSNRFFARLFLPPRFYWSGAALAIGWVAGYFLPVLIPIVNWMFWIWLILVGMDLLLVGVLAKPPLVRREMADRMSNGDRSKVSLRVQSRAWFTVQITLIDELPDPFQLREFSLSTTLKPDQEWRTGYTVRPVERGPYTWYDIITYQRSRLGLISCRHISAAEKTVSVYPSFVQLRQYELRARSATTMELGNRKLRKIGHSLEFEQIKEYVRGDDVRTINWKATARRAALMVNQYTDERSQQVFLIIDKGRLMRMPFNQLTLLDHAINAALVLAHVGLQRQDRVGLITFSRQLDTVLAADRKTIQLTHILQALYQQKTDFAESDFEWLHLQLRAQVRQRSLLVLFTNFETITGLKRQLPYLRALAKHHLLLVVFFENTELSARANLPAANLEDVYAKTLAEKLVLEKRLIARELTAHGILSLLCPPEGLTPNVINKYLELKARQAS